jgi:hypothetical protein
MKGKQFFIHHSSFIAHHFRHPVHPRELFFSQGQRQVLQFKPQRARDNGDFKEGGEEGG